MSDFMTPKKSSDFIAYIEKTNMNRIFTFLFRQTGFIHPSMKLDVKDVRESSDGENFRVEADVLNDEEYHSVG